MYRSLYQKYFETLLKTDEVIVIQGQRRVGKSSFVISYLKENHIDLKKVFYLNKELDIEEMVRDSGDLQECFNTFRNLYGKPDYLIIDEIQMIKNRELFINGQRAKGGTRIIITGSNSKLLSGELATNLTGRHLTIQIFPLSYEEFLQFNQKEQSDETFLEYLEFGGMPWISFVELQAKKEYLKNLLHSIVFKDIVERYSIREVSLLNRLLAYLSNNIGSLVSITNIANYLKQQFRDTYSLATITNYLEHFEVPYLVNQVKRYDLKGKKILEYSGKYYRTDIWLRNSFWYNFTNDINKILENVVYIKLRQLGYEVYIGNIGDLEIDFVGVKQNEKIYIQVCYLLATPEVVEREFWNLAKIKDNYKKLVLSMDKLPKSNNEGIERENIVDWLLKE